jgi:membrane-associated phospholipid phosphatase
MEPGQTTSSKAVLEMAQVSRRAWGEPSFRTLLRRVAVSLVACCLLVTLAYHFVDRPVAFFVQEHRLNRPAALEWMTHTAMAFDALAALTVVLTAVRLALGQPSRLERTLFAAALSLMAAVALEFYLKPLFGRYWPQTWVTDNPSLIRDDAYGFHPLHSGSAYGSFPSGHTARAVAFLWVVWAAYPRWGWLCLLAVVSVAVGLVGMNYHFVGDTIGGAFLGACTGMYAARLAGVSRGPDVRPDAVADGEPPVGESQPVAKKSSQ